MDKKNGVAIAAVTGAVIGAAAGAYLSNSKNRQKLTETAKRVKDEGGKYVEDFKATAHEIKKDAEEKVSEAKSQMTESGKAPGRKSRNKAS